ncbi:reverse transcriptase domain-containing protein [Tanacetum coccineum]
MTKLLMKYAKFDFSDDCKKALSVLKEKLTTAPIIISPDWNVPFELMCDASDFVVGAVLGQRIDGKFKPIYYASKTLNNAQEHYTTTKKEILAVVFSFDKFWFDIEIKDKRGAENLAVVHLSRLENPDLGTFTEEEIVDEFPDEHLMVLKIELNNDEPCNSKKPFMELNELMELRDGAYENTRIYKERANKWHDSRLRGDCWVSKVSTSYCCYLYKLVLLVLLSAAGEEC